MAGKPISRAYAALIDKVGISTILDKVANGETMGAIAQSIGVSRWFLSTYLNRDDYVSDALDMCRAQAAQKRLAAHPKGMGGREARQWVADAPAAHLAALKVIRAQDRGEAECKPGEDRAGQHPQAALLRKDAPPVTTPHRGVCAPEDLRAFRHAAPISASGPADVERLTQ